MPPKKNTDGESSSSSSLNEGDSRFIKAMFDNMNSRPDIDWDKLGKDMSMTPKSAKERLRKMSKRYNWNTDSGGSSGGSPAKTKGPLAPKNTGKVAKTGTPKKGTAQKKGKSKKDESDDDEDISSKLGSDSDGKAVAQDEFMASTSESDE
ncbi:hypothetical protein CkaCkLH20_04870 [Colletotrichum karsti]|uniref:Uncharacterized protein n=1 Tax=Colletotrichum karsti TaxID=1095194 RepID=A0A9P6IFI1_9PEZI|nr:uncharacterized protein CkaCkLH20_04870 [Colletotrichum karsti]KAF9877735.1 hypothetical protein CkaCkLH20_04870 [Colletotrichum karsti]